MLNIAHRGARSLAPENTLLAAHLGLAAGAHLWETDVAVTRDEALVLMHDDRLTRTTDVARRFPLRAHQSITTFTLQEIRCLDAGSWFLEDDPFGQIATGAVSAESQRACQAQKVPTLEEALVWTRDHHWGINLELKRLPRRLAHFPVVARVLATIQRVGLNLDQVAISSFNHAWLHQARGVKPTLRIQALIGENADRPLDWGPLTFDTYNVRHTLVSDEELRQRKQAGIVINLFTVNDETDMRRYQGLGIDGLFTDFPQRLNALA